MRVCIYVCSSYVVLVRHSCTTYLYTYRGGEVMRVPWLRTELLKEIQKAVTSQALWPKRMLVPSMDAKGIRPILSREKLRELEQSDPLLKAENLLKETPLLREEMEKSAAKQKSMGELLKVLVVASNADS